VKSTVAKLCGVGIVYLIFLLTEMKCHDGMFSYREDSEIEEEEINAALKRVLILLDQVNDLSISAK
jgi:Ca2+/H+ antiporter